MNIDKKLSLSAESILMFIFIKIVFFFLFNKIILSLQRFSKSIVLFNAGVVKLVDTPDLGSGAARLGGSSPSTRTLFECLQKKITIFI